MYSRAYISTGIKEHKFYVNSATHNKCYIKFSSQTWLHHGHKEASIPLGIENSTQNYNEVF